MALFAFSGRFTAVPFFTPRSPAAPAPPASAPLDRRPCPGHAPSRGAGFSSAIGAWGRSWSLAPVRRLGPQRLGNPGIRPLLLVMVLWLLAMLIAPEHPWDQEAICQRHNGVAACRVW
ncbi:MAG: hypothetical protein ACKOXO_07365 [Cyanobium sp.]